MPADKETKVEEETKWFNGRLFKRRNVKPDDWGVLHIPDGWMAEEINWETGIGRGWEPIRNEFSNKNC